ncbi:hypothetical protein MNV49_004597 [Pseudohyphozyma bogoriensis]|nr:hypothetical protein MNV49_004597 [Pseudohyphozyma bogoriensis]
MSFAGAPISKAFIIGLGCTTLGAAATGRQYLLDVPLSPHLTRDHQFWRIPLHHLAYANSSELFLGIIVLFFTAVSVERMFGSVKFGSFLVVVTALSTVLELVVLLLFAKTSFTKLPAGPFAITCAIAYQYIRIVPSTFHWKFFSIDVSSNFGLYVVLSQLVTSQTPSTILVSLVGILSSYLYRANFLRVRSYRLSGGMVFLLSKLFAPLIGDMAAPPRANTLARGLTGAPAQPTTAQIEQLSAMFPNSSREAVVGALQRSQMDVNRAAEALLSG